MFWTALPIRDAVWLCRRDDTGTQPIREIPSGSVGGTLDLGRVAVSQGGFAAVFSGAKLFIVPPNESLPTVVGLPEDLDQVHAVHFRDDVLYIGGRASWQDTSRLGWIDVTEPEPIWHSLEPPHVVGDPALPVYALFSTGPRLIALDGSFTPKLALLYDISDPRNPRYMQHASIASGIDDVPIDASMGRSYAAILSQSTQNSGKAWKIGLFDAQSMDEVATFYEHSANPETIETPRRVLVHDDLLLIAHDLKGLGVVKLDDRQPSHYEVVSAIRPWAQSYVPLHRLEYHKPLGQGRVIDVRPTSHPNIFYIVIQRGGRQWWEEIVLR